MFYTRINITALPNSRSVERFGRHVEIVLDSTVKQPRTTQRWQKSTRQYNTALLNSRSVERFGCYVEIVLDSTTKQPRTTQRSQKLTRQSKRY